MTSDAPWELDVAAAENSSQPLLNLCISFAILETFFIIAFIFSWYFNNNNSNNNTRAVLLLIFAGYIFCFTGVVLGILEITLGGAGYHAAKLQRSTIRRMLQLVKAHEVIYVLSIPMPKLAMLCLYFRLFTTKTAHCLLYATGLIVVATSLFGFISAFANCRPMSSFWNDPQHAQCTMDTMTAFRYYSVPNIATDAIMLLIPGPALWKLNVSPLVKAGVILTFVISTFGIVTAILRFVSFVNGDMFADITFRSISNICWTIVEPGVYLVAATIPTLRPLVRRMCRELHAKFPVTQLITDRCKQTYPSTRADRSPVPPHHAPRNKESSGDLLRTIGRQPSRALLLDEYHKAQCYDKGTKSRESAGGRSIMYAVRSGPAPARDAAQEEAVSSPARLYPVRLSSLGAPCGLPGVQVHGSHRI